MKYGKSPQITLCELKETRLDSVCSAHLVLLGLNVTYTAAPAEYFAKGQGYRLHGEATATF